jgi:hypothetical protein
VEANGARKDDALYVAPFADQILHGVAVADANDILFDDRPFIEIRRDIVTGRANEFHTSLIRLRVGIRADKGREERMMNIDDLIGIMRNKRFRQYLHVAREHDEIDLQRCQQFQLSRFLCLLRIPCNGKDMVGYPVPFGQRAQSFMIAHDDDEIGGQLAQMVAVEKIGQAVVELRDKKRHPRTLIGKSEFPIHAQRVGERLEVMLDLILRETARREIPLHALKKSTGLKVYVLIGMKNVPVVAKNEIRNLIDQSFLILTGHQ